ncbi:MAG: YbaK/EbsC family protein [Pontibacterium sp.]
MCITALAPTVQNFLNHQRISYKRIFHTYAKTALDCAIAAQVPARQVAQGVVLKDNTGFLLALVPANRRVDLHALRQLTRRQLTPHQSERHRPVIQGLRTGGGSRLGANL